MRASVRSFAISFSPLLIDFIRGEQMRISIVVAASVLLVASAACGNTASIGINQAPQKYAPLVWQTGPGVDHWRQFSSMPSEQCSMTADRAGNVYYLTYNGIDKMNYSGTAVHFAGPGTTNSGGGALTSGNDGNVWAALGDVYRMTPVGVFTRFTVGKQAGYIARGSGSDIWYTSGGVYRLNYATNTTATYPVPAGAGQAQAIAVGNDGNVWFLTANAVNRLNPSTGQIAAYAKNGIGSSEAGYPNAPNTALTVGPDGNIWSFNGKLYRITSSGAISGPFAISGTTYINSVYPQFAVAGGFLWLSAAATFNAESYYGVLIRVAVDGSTTEYIPPNFFISSSGLQGGATSAADGNVWFCPGNIGVYVLLPIVVTPYSVTINSVGANVTLNVSQPPYSGPWIASSTSTGVVHVVKWLSVHQLEIEATGVGKARVIIRDQRDNYYDVPVTVK